MKSAGLGLIITIVSLITFAEFATRNTSARCDEFSKNRIGWIRDRNTGLVSIMYTNWTLSANCCRNTEVHNFQGQGLKFAAYQENNAVNIVNNGTGISGACGEIWNALADYLNFTIQLVNFNDLVPGMKFPNGSFNGLVGRLVNNQVDVVPRMPFLGHYFGHIDFTLQFWTTRMQLFVKPTYNESPYWVIESFSCELWLCILIVLILLTYITYYVSRREIRQNNADYHHSFLHQFFETIAISTSQGDLPEELGFQMRWVYLLTTLFSWMIVMAFNSNSIYLMTYKYLEKPFTSLDTLFASTSYHIATAKGHKSSEDMRDVLLAKFPEQQVTRRFLMLPSRDEIFKSICHESRDKFVIIVSEDWYRSDGKLICNLVASGFQWEKAYLGSATALGHPHKRQFDSGILKLIESGLLYRIYNVWMYTLPPEKPPSTYGVGFDQVSLIFVILCIGFSFASIILGIEMVIFKILKLSDTRNTG